MSTENDWRTTPRTSEPTWRCARVRVADGPLAGEWAITDPHEAGMWYRWRDHELETARWDHLVASGPVFSLDGDRSPNEVRSEPSEAAERLRAVLAIQDRDERPDVMGCGYRDAPLLRSDIRALVEHYEAQR